jgi:hypothetical protein
MGARAGVAGPVLPDGIVDGKAEGKPAGGAALERGTVAAGGSPPGPCRVTPLAVGAAGWPAAVPGAGGTMVVLQAEDAAGSGGLCATAEVDKCGRHNTATASTERRTHIDNDRTLTSRPATPRPTRRFPAEHSHQLLRSRIIILIRPRGCLWTMEFCVPVAIGATALRHLLM